MVIWIYLYNSKLLILIQDIICQSITIFALSTCLAWVLLRIKIPDSPAMAPNITVRRDLFMFLNYGIYLL